MSWVDVMIPGGIGLLMVVAPGSFTKAEGEAGVSARAKLRKIGGLLLLVAALYAAIAVGQRA